MPYNYVINKTHENGKTIEYTAMDSVSSQINNTFLNASGCEAQNVMSNTPTLDTATLEVIETTVKKTVESTMREALDGVKNVVETSVREALEQFGNSIQNTMETSLRRVIQELRSLRRDVAEQTNLKPTVGSNSTFPKEPFDCLEEFLAFEDRLQNDEDAFRQFKIEVKSQNKFTGAKFVRYIWHSLMSDDLAKQFSWRGTPEKKAVRILTVALAIRDVFIHEIHGKEEEYTSATKAVF